MIRQFIYSFLLRASIPAFGVLNFMIIVRLFDRDQVGVWVLYMTILALVEVAKDGFLKNATVWLLNKENDDQQYVQSILSSSFLLNLVVALALVIVNLVAALILQGSAEYADLGTLLIFYCMNLLINVVYNHFEYFLNAQVKFRPIMFAYLIKNLSLFILLLVSYFFMNDLVDLSWLVCFQAVGILLGVLLLTINTKVSFSIRKAKKVHISKILGFGKYVFATNASSVLFRSTDHYMLAGMIGSGSVAFYNVALRITNLVDLPSTAAAEVIFPISVKSNDRKELRGIYERTVGYIVALAIPVTLFIYINAEFIIVFIAGTSYLSSVLVLKITLIYGLLLPFLKQFGTLMNAINKPKVNFGLMFFTFLINVISNYFFIAHFGLMGAAYGTLLSYCVSFLLSQVLLNKYFGVRFDAVVRNVFVAYYDLGKRIIKKS